tara:strand:- start:124 stop:732 length:609 start_codon:yes stop_codon:yes gene_type:complete
LATAVVSDHIAVVAVFTIIDDFITAAGFRTVLAAGIRPVVTVVVAIVAGFFTAGADVPVAADGSPAVVDARIRVVVIAVIALLTSFHMTVATAYIFTLPVSTDLFGTAGRRTIRFDLTRAATAIPIDDVAVVTILNPRLEVGIATSSIGTVAVGEVHTGVRTHVITVVTFLIGILPAITADHWAADQFPSFFETSLTIATGR